MVLILSQKIMNRGFSIIDRAFMVSRVKTIVCVLTSKCLALLVLMDCYYFLC